MMPKSRKKNLVAKDLFTPKYKPKVEAKLKGKGSYDRKKDAVLIKSLENNHD